MNLPNKITISRIFLAVVTVVVFLCPFKHAYLIAAIIFVIAALTDFLDGYLARKTNAITTMGKFLDPIADKILVISATILLLEKAVLPSPYGAIAIIIIISRELIIGSFRQVAAAASVILAADKLGKLKTVLQDVSIPFLLISVKDNIYYNDSIYYIGLSIFGLSVLVAVISAINYMVINRSVIKH
ncbi:MAG: CDP-diacylglycerol--glycerol-3-phosphate 3-phosphatidyltransferase [Christensenellaceae bacterium]|jgi:CDP-diacylglycerol--glycerol-3-phosphate 3-phosphatidyltransferase|nr:CDP-diacylglycerol--glycerol-3-phosphate 3-phosphatidyltransferase [Christensenellaceae bacterium]